MKKCGICGASLIEGAKFCYQCGINIEKMESEREEKQRRGEIPVERFTLQTSVGEKKIEIWCRDLTEFPEKIDILTVSAFRYIYGFFSRSLMGALYAKRKLNTGEYARHPFMDLRQSVGCWISTPVDDGTGGDEIGRLGCIEMRGAYSSEEEVLLGIKGYCHLLDLAALAGVKMETVAMPIIGTGLQHIDFEKIMIPLGNEIISLLKRNSSIHKLMFVEINYDKAKKVSDELRKSYQFSYEERDWISRDSSREPFVFISYSHDGDKDTAEILCQILRERGISTWFAPKEISSGEYPEQIVKAIDRCTHFIIIISEKSMKSHHVLNELNLAFSLVGDGVKILPFRMDMQDMTPAFRYYLSTMQWHYGCPPPLEAKAREFIDQIFG